MCHVSVGEARCRTRTSTSADINGNHFMCLELITLLAKVSL